MGDEAHVLENTQVLRDRGSADGEPGCEVPDRPGPGAEKLEDLPPRRVSQRVQRMSVSYHLP
jgi:hypothetical protein